MSFYELRTVLLKVSDELCQIRMTLGTAAVAHVLGTFQ